MAYTADSFKASLVWGRVGASVLALVSFILGLLGYQLGPEEQSALVEIGSSLLAGVAGVLAITSKVREQKKAKD